MIPMPAWLITFDFATFVHTTVVGQVIFSKIGALIVFSLAYKAYTVQKAHEILLAAALRTGSSLPEPVKEEITTYFKKHHGLTIGLSDSEGCVAWLMSFQYKGRKFIFIPAQDRTVLCEGLTHGLDKKNIFAMLDHEADHFKHPDVLIRNICATLIEPTALLAGKIANIYGVDIVNSIVIGVFVNVLGAVLKQKLISQRQEKRCDFAAGTTPEKCLAIADYLKVRFLPLDQVATPYQIIIHRFFGDHPLNAVRIGYMEKRAEELEQQK